MVAVKCFPNKQLGKSHAPSWTSWQGISSGKRVLKPSLYCTPDTKVQHPARITTIVCTSSIKVWGDLARIVVDYCKGHCLFASWLQCNTPDLAWVPADRSMKVESADMASNHRE